MSLVYFLKVDIEVKPEKREEFIRYTVILTEQIKQRRKWEMVAALSAITGQPNMVVHLWKIPDANSLLEGMNYFSSDKLSEWYSPLMECCVSQRQELYTAMDYNPQGRNSE